MKKQYIARTYSIEKTHVLQVVRASKKIKQSQNEVIRRAIELYTESLASK